MKTTASSGHEAADIVAAEHPGCVVVAFDADLRAEGPSAWDVLAWANEDDRFEDDGAKAVARYTIHRAPPE